MNIRIIIFSMAVTACSILIHQESVIAQGYSFNSCTATECYCGRCTETKAGPPPPTLKYAPVQPKMGTFAVPPQVGEVMGESKGFGIRGMSLSFPSITLELPSITMPSLFRTRRDAHMRVDKAVAPFVPGQPAMFGQIPVNEKIEKSGPDPTPKDGPNPSCTDFENPDKSASRYQPNSIPPAPGVAEMLRSLSPSERLLVLRILEERKKNAALEQRMSQLSQTYEAVGVNVHSLQNTDSVFYEHESANNPAAPRVIRQDFGGYSFQSQQSPQNTTSPIRQATYENNNPNR